MRAVLYASTIMAGLMAASNAMSQATTNEPAAPQSTGAVSELVVTGSRIPRANLVSEQPVATISGQEIQQRGFTNLADIIQQLPSAGAGITPIGPQNDFGVGRNYIDLFSLGSNHTLTLVDGNRFVGDNPTNIFANTPGNQVDLNALPTLFVDRIEEVPATGAAVYGSDAISGVVNIILKKRFEGEEITVQRGTSTYGDAPHTTVEGAIGHDFLGGKLNVAVDFQYDQTSALTYADRPSTAAGYTFAPNPAYTGQSSGVPASILVSDQRFSGVTAGGLPFQLDGQSLIYLPGTNTPAQFGANGNLVSFNPGTVYGQFIGGTSSGGDSLSTVPLTALQTPLNRKVVTAMASYDGLPHVHFHITGFYSNNSAVETINQPNYSDLAFGAAPAYNQPSAGGALLISSQNAFLTQQAQSVLAANGVGDFYLSRANTDITPDPIRSSVETYDVNFKVDGDFTLFHHQFNWNADWVRGASWSRFDQDNIVFGNPSFNVPDLFGYALDSVTGANGQPQCRVTQQNPGSTNPYISGCIPFNPFGVGNNSAAGLRYFTADFGNHAANKQDDGQFNINTSLLKLPAGNLKFSAGYEYHREEASFTPSLASAEGIGYSIPIIGQQGAYETNEYYFEGLIPILGPGFNFPLGYKFEMDGAYRKVRNSLAGQNEAWSFGGRYSPIKDITLRGSRSKTFAAPPLTALFASSSQGYDSGADPCQASNLTAGPNPKARQANCSAAFAALGANLGTFTDSLVGNETIPVTLGGNPNLKNEVGNSWTYGVLLQPRYVPGLTMSADYIKINISNLIEFEGIQTLLESCYDNPSYPTAPCGQFTRNSQGQVQTANETFINAGYELFTAMSYAVDYERSVNQLPFVHDDRDLGRLSFSFNALNTRQNAVSVSGLGYDTTEYAGTLGSPNNNGAPRWRWLAGLRYSLGPVHAGWTTHFIGDSYYNLTFTSANQDILKVGRNITHDLSLAYDVNQHATIRLNINNITNEAPPYPVTYQAGYYDFLGRYFQFQISARF